MRRKFRILFFALYFLGVLLFLEASLQGFYYFTVGQTLLSRTGQPLYVANSFSGFFNKPHLAVNHNTNEFRSFIYTNGAGFRVPRPDLEYELEKPAGTNRVLLLGPSFAFGWGVNYDDSFAAKLQDLLGMQVINTGVPGLVTYSQFVWYQNVGRQYHADLVLQVIYGSMAVDRSPADYVVNDAGYLLPNDLTNEERIIDIAKNSALVFYAWNLYAKAVSMPATTIAGAGRRLPITPKFSTDEPITKEALTYYFDLRSAVRESGATPVIVYAPLSYLVHRSDIARWRHLGVENVDQQLEFDREFCSYLTSHDLICINLTPSLIDAATTEPERLYYWLDVHWTKRGNAVAAAAVAAALKHLSVTRPPALVDR